MRRSFYSLTLLLLTVMLPASSRAQTDQPKEKTKTDETAEKKVKVKPLNLYGLNLFLSLSSANALNIAGEGEEWFLQYDFRMDWSLGSLFFKKNKILKGLRTSVTFQVRNELMGTDPSFRSSDYKGTSFAGGQLEYLPISAYGYLSPSGSDSTQYQVSGTQRRADYSDIGIAVLNGSWYEVPKAKINIDGGLKFSIPTSLQSRAKGLNTILSASLGLSRTFKLPKKTSISLGYNFAWIHYFWKAKTPYIMDKYNSWEASNTAASGTDDMDYNAEAFNPHDAMINGVWGSVSFLKYFTFYADYNYIWIAPYQSNSYCVVDIGNGLTTDACENTYDVRGYGRPLPWQLKNIQAVSLRLMYRPLPYLTATTGFMTEAPERKPNSSSYQQALMVTNYNRYTYFFVTLTLNTELLLKKIMGRETKPKTTRSRDDLIAGY